MGLNGKIRIISFSGIFTKLRARNALVTVK